MADLRSRFIEDYAGGLLNVARQELSTTGEVLVQDGFTTEGTIFVEDGSGTKSGLRLGVSLAEVVDPTTETGVVNVRFADRTYAKIRDLKIFSTAIASAQAALSEAASTSISNVETTIQLLEDDFDALNQEVSQILENQDLRIDTFITEQKATTDQLLALSELFDNRLQEIEGSALSFSQLEDKFNLLEQETENNIAEFQVAIDGVLIELNEFKSETNSKFEDVENSQRLNYEAINIKFTALEDSVQSFKDTELNLIIQAQDNKIANQDSKIEVQNDLILAQNLKIDSHDTQFVALDSRIDTFIERQVQFDQDLYQNQLEIDSLKSRVEILEAQVSALQDAVAALQSAP